MPREYRISLKTQVMRRLLRAGFRVLFFFLSPLKITGKENVPRQGAYLIAINHISLYEAPLMLTYWPRIAEAIGAVDIWGRKGQSLLVELWDAIPAHRGQFDRQLLERVFAALRAGHPLLIAPEGGRSHTPGMRKAQPGVAYIADKMAVPVVPVGLVGTTDDYAKRAFRGQRPALEIRIGKPFNLPPIQGSGMERRAALQENADRTMRAIAALLPPEYRGNYGP